MFRPACKDFPNFKGFKFDPNNQNTSTAQQQQPQQQQQQQHHHHHHHHQGETHRTANIQKFSSLGRRPLPQTPDEKARKQPPIIPKVPTTISQNVEIPLNVSNFRSLQRGAWQDTSTFHPGLQFRSLQRGVTVNPPTTHSQFRSAKIQDQTQNEAMYANTESERQLYAVTEL